MHTSRDDYLINTLRFISAKEETQIYDAISESLNSPEMKETKAYKTYLGFATGATPPKKAVKRPIKKSTKAPARGVVIGETLEIPLSKKKEKSMRDFHKTHPSGSGNVTKTALSAAKIKLSVTNEGNGVKPGVPNVTEEESSESEAESWRSDEDDRNNEQDSSGEDSDQENDSDDDKPNQIMKTIQFSSMKLMRLNSITDKSEGDEDEEKDYITSQLYDDVDIRLNKPVDTDKGFVQEEGIDAAMTNTEVLVTSSSHSSDLVAKFLNFSYIPHTDANIVSPMDVHVHHEVPSQQTPTLLTIPVLVISDSSPIFSTVIPQSLPSFTSPPHQSTSTPPPTTTNPSSTRPDFASVFRFNNRVTTLEKEAAATLTKFDLKKIMIDKMDKSESYLATPEHRECYEGLKKSYNLEKTIFSTYGKVYSLKRSRKDKDKDLFVGSERGLKKRKTSKDAAPATVPKSKESQSGSSKCNKSQSKSSGKSILSKEPKFEVAELDMPQDQEENPGPAFRLLKGSWLNYAESKYDFENVTKPYRRNLIGKNPKGGGIATMTYMTSLMKTKAAQYDLPGIEDMVSNIWSSIKVAYDKYALWVTRIEIMRKHGYGYLKEIENRLTNLSGDDVFDFAIALRMFTRSRVIQKRVKDLQLAVESYQKKIIVTKPETTRLGIRKKDPYTPYRDPQGFIYVDTLGRNRLMRSDELYKQLKERRILRSLEKFVGGRHYETDPNYFNDQYDLVILCSSS
nr:hypothetical protein [Tanacetum cinerariifolium]